MLYPIGIQDFKSLRKDSYLYIDKTDLIYQLVKTGCYYFLSRPRRFGKSLLISTLEAYFSGRKELFRGLAIDKLEKEWKVYPVLHLDLNIEKYDSPDSLYAILNDALTKWEGLYGTAPEETTLALRFKGIISRAYEKTGTPVVILVDEYDKPLLQAIGDKPLQEEFRATLKPFYGVLKTMDRCIKFGMLTGVTKFGKTSVFSDLNNLKDISMDRRYVNLCGITEQELHANLEPQLHELAESQGVTYEEMCHQLKERYDGYHFMEDSEGIYNPFSLLNVFDSQRLGSYWFATGTPTYLVKLLKQNKFRLENLITSETDVEVLDNVYGDDKPLPVIYQSGYLTIKSYNKEFGLYTLGFPNKEVEEGFMKFLLPSYASVDESEAPSYIRKFVEEIRSGDIDAFFRRLQSFFADTPYELIRDQELHYQNVLFIVFKLIGFYVKAEYHTSQGRIDLVLQTSGFVYVMEFKLEGTAEEALRQIEEKGYAVPFQTDGRKVYKIGVNFSSSTRNIQEWKVEE